MPIWQQYVHAAADLRNMFGFADGIAHPAVEGTGIPGTNPYEVPLKAGEFVLGYEDEFHNISPVPQPEVLGRNGTYAVFRKLPHSHSRFPPVPAPARQGPHRGGVAGRQDRRTLAQRGAAGTDPGKGRSRTWGRPKTQQRLHVRRRPAWPQVPDRRACPTYEPARLNRHWRSALAPHD